MQDQCHSFEHLDVGPLHPAILGECEKRAPIYSLTVSGGNQAAQGIQIHPGCLKHAPDP